MDQFKEFFNFDNVGGKIKNFTKWACWISIIVIWVAAAGGVIYSIYHTSEYGLSGIGYLSIIGGGMLTFLIWISSWPMYGFGVMIENSCALAGSEDVEEEYEEYEEESSQLTAPMIVERFDEKDWSVPNDDNIKCAICGADVDLLFPCATASGKRIYICEDCKTHHKK